MGSVFSQILWLVQSPWIFTMGVLALGCLKAPLNLSQLHCTIQAFKGKVLYISALTTDNNLKNEGNHLLGPIFKLLSRTGIELPSGLFFTLGKKEEKRRLFTQCAEKKLILQIFYFSNMSTVRMVHVLIR